MRNPTVLNRCTVQKRNGSFCDTPSAPHMPFPICQHHALKLFDHMRPDIPAPETAKEVWDLMRADLAEKRPEMDELWNTMGSLRAEQSVVYYVKTGDFIKIGYTGDMKLRMSAMRIPESNVLATEPGARDAERQRHLQFAHLRQGRLENFTPAPELLDLIAKLRRQFGPPNITDSCGIRAQATAMLERTAL